MNEYKHQVIFYVIDSGFLSKLVLVGKANNMNY